MPLPPRPRYTVYLNPTDEAPEGTVLVAEITHADQLRGELEAGKQGLPPVNVAPINHTTVWVWCALTRTHAYAGDFRQFKHVDVAGIEPVRDAAGDPEVTTVDPTRPDPGSGSA